MTRLNPNRADSYGAGGDGSPGDGFLPFTLRYGEPAFGTLRHPGPPCTRQDTTHQREPHLETHRKDRGKRPQLSTQAEALLCSLKSRNKAARTSPRNQEAETAITTDEILQGAFE